MDAKKTYTDAQMKCIEEHRLDTTQHDTHWAECTISDFIDGLALFGIDVSTETNQSYPRNGTSHVTVTPKIHWDVSYCQGSGAQFLADRFSIAHFMEEARRAFTDPKADNWWISADEKPAWAKVLLAQLEWCESEYLKYQLNGNLWSVLQATEIVPSLERGHYNHNQYMGVEIDRESMDLIDDHPEHVRDAMGKLYTELGGTEDTWREFMRDLANGLHRELEAEYEFQQSDDAVWEHIVANDLFHPTTDEGEV